MRLVTVHESQICQQRFDIPALRRPCNLASQDFICSGIRVPDPCDVPELLEQLEVAAWRWQAKVLTQLSIVASPWGTLVLCGKALVAELCGIKNILM